MKKLPFKNGLPFEKQTIDEKKTIIENEILLYEKKPRSWVDSEPKKLDFGNP